MANVDFTSWFEKCNCISPEFGDFADHHQFFSHNVTDEEIALDQAEWEALKLHYVDGKIALNKTNLFARAHTFFTNNITPETATFSQTLARG